MQLIIMSPFEITLICEPGSLCLSIILLRVCIYNLLVIDKKLESLCQVLSTSDLGGVATLRVTLG